MATHSSIPAWEIPWIEEPGKATVHGVAKNWTWLKQLRTTQHQTWDLLASQLVLFFFLQRFLFLTMDLTMYVTCRESEYSQSGREESSLSHTNRVQALKRTYRDIWMPRKEPVWLLWGRESYLFSTGGGKMTWEAARFISELQNVFCFFY